MTKDFDAFKKKHHITTILTDGDISVLHGKFMKKAFRVCEVPIGMQDNGVDCGIATALGLIRFIKARPQATEENLINNFSRFFSAEDCSCNQSVYSWERYTNMPSICKK